jgi:hypothetical protein
VSVHLRSSIQSVPSRCHHFTNPFWKYVILPFTPISRTHSLLFIYCTHSHPCYPSHGKETEQHITLPITLLRVFLYMTQWYELLTLRTWAWKNKIKWDSIFPYFYLDIWDSRHACKFCCRQIWFVSSRRHTILNISIICSYQFAPTFFFYMILDNKNVAL